MFNVIEALWLYSSNRKVVDDDFINSVINMHLLDLKGYNGTI